MTLKSAKWGRGEAKALFVSDVGEKEFGVLGGGLGSRRKLWLGTSQSNSAKCPPLPPDSVTAGKEPRQFQEVSGEIWG